jgi:hypothetical protein
MSAAIIQFTSRARHRTEVPPAEAQPAVGFVANECRRKQRREQWWRAERATEFYWKLLALSHCVRSATRAGVAEAPSYDGDSYAIAKLWRAAVAAQIRTPAHTQAAVAWKKRYVGRDHDLPIDAENIERIIARDEAWLKEYPSRQVSSNQARKRKE